MKPSDFGQDKIKEICENLQEEAIAPARKQADAIIREARDAEKRIIEEAERKREQILAEARRAQREEMHAFRSSINSGCKRVLTRLEEAIKKEFFNKGVGNLLEGELRKPSAIAELLSSLVRAIEKEGIGGEIAAIVPKALSQEMRKELVEQLHRDVLERLKDRGVELGEIKGGVKVQISEKNLTIDISEEALKEILAEEVREDFRAIIFSKELDDPPHFFE